MTKTQLLERVQELGGFSPDSAEKAIEATIEALGAVLVSTERRAVAEHLPEPMRNILETSAHLPDLDLTGFYERAGRRERARAGRAREHVQIVCRVLAETLPSDVIEGLRRHLPRLTSLFELPESTMPPEAPERSARPPHPEAPPHTLASGRPGSRHPLTDARPDRAHAHSVVRSENPHGDTKLSSTHGFTQERERETLATGRPGPKRTLSG